MPTIKWRESRVDALNAAKKKKINFRSFSVAILIVARILHFRNRTIGRAKGVSLRLLPSTLFQELSPLSSA